MSMLRTVGKNIRYIRESQGYSQEELAAKAGLNRSYIGHIERGEGNLTLSKLCEIANALHIVTSIAVDGSDTLLFIRLSRTLKEIM